MTAMQFTMVFLGVLLGKTALTLWLKLRYIRYIQAHIGAVPAAFSETVTLAQHQKAIRYQTDKAYTQIVATILDAAILLLFTLGGGVEWLLQHTHFWPYSDVLNGISMILSVVLLHQLITLPLAAYQVFVVEARHGFNKMTVRLFIVDNIKSLLLTLLFATPVTATVLYLIQHSGELWWLYAWLFWLGLSITLLVLYPTFIAPLFNTFRPLPDPALTTRIESLLTRCGFNHNGIFVMDGSRRSSHGNAYFTGLGKSKRIVFFDTLLNQLNPDEIEAVLAHELGHFKKKHISKRLAISFIVTLALFWAVGQLTTAGWFFHGLGVNTVNHATALTLFFLVVPAFLFFLAPLSNALSRKYEYEADTYAAQITQSEHLVQALIKLHRDNASPLLCDALHSLFYDSHPPASLRIQALQQLGSEGKSCI